MIESPPGLPLVYNDALGKGVKEAFCRIQVQQARPLLAQCSLAQMLLQEVNSLFEGLIQWIVHPNPWSS